MTTGAEGADRVRYREIADALRSAIASGEFPQGSRIPGENTVMADYGVVRMTARRALDVLKAEGLVVARPGSGTFVRDFHPLRRLGVERVAREQWGSGRSIWDADLAGRHLDVDHVHVGEDEAPGGVAAVLELSDDARVLRRSRRYVLDGKPVLLASSYLPLTLVADSAITEKDPGPGGIYARLAELGHEPVHFREEVRARMPIPDEAEELRLETGTPVLLVARTAFRADGRAVEVNHMTMDAASYVLEYEFDS